MRDTEWSQTRDMAFLVVGVAGSCPVDVWARVLVVYVEYTRNGSRKLMDGDSHGEVVALLVVGVAGTDVPSRRAGPPASRISNPTLSRTSGAPHAHCTAPVCVPLRRVPCLPSAERCMARCRWARWSTTRTSHRKISSSSRSPSPPPLATRTSTSTQVRRPSRPSCLC